MQEEERWQPPQQFPAWPIQSKPDHIPGAERVDIDPGQSRRFEGFTVRHLLKKEAARGVLVPQHRRRGQVPFSDHPGPVPSQQRIQWSERRPPSQGDAHLTQITQQGRHRAAPRDARMAGLVAGEQERRHPVLVELPDLQTLGRQPHPDLAQILEHVPDRSRRLPTLPQPNPVTLDLRPHPTSLSPRTRHRTRLLVGARCPVGPRAKWRCFLAPFGTQHGVPLRP